MKRNRNIPIKDRKALVAYINQFPVGSTYRGLAVKREAARYNVTTNSIYWHVRNQ